MRKRFFVIWGGQKQKRNAKIARPSVARGNELNTEILKKSPCLHCELFVSGNVCPYANGCSKIDEFQRVASAHCTLHKPQDIRSLT
jgi:hypothetical protein